MLLGLNYLKPRPRDDGKAVEACCKSWIAYRDAQRASPPADKPDVDSLPPDTAEAQWRQRLVEPKALTNLDLKDGELWIAVGYLQLKGENATARVQGRPGQGRVDNCGANATCSPCRLDARSKNSMVNQEKNHKRPHANRLPANQRCLCVNHPECDGRVGKAGQSCVKCQAPPS